MWNTDIIFKHGYLMKIPIELSRKKSACSVYVYGALDVRLFPNKRLNVDLKNIEIWVSHGLKIKIQTPNPIFILELSYTLTVATYLKFVRPMVSASQRERESHSLRGCEQEQ